MSVRAAVRAALLGVMAAIAGLEFHRVFGWSPVAARVVLAAVLATAVPVLLQWRRPRSVAFTVTVSLVVGALYTGIAVLNNANAAFVIPTPDTLHDIADGIVNGWSRILTTSLPAPDRPDLLVLPVVLTWVAAAAGVEVGLRTRHSILALFPGTVAFGTALLFGVGVAGNHVAPAAVFAAAAVLSVRLADNPSVVRSGAEEGSARRSTHVPAVIFLTVVVLLAAFVGPRLPGASGNAPYDPRDDRAPRVEQLTAVNPLALLADWGSDAKDTALFTVRADRPRAWRLAVLDTYDGTQWTATTSLLEPGPDLPSASGVNHDGDVLVQDVTIRNLDGVWLPAADRPTRVDGTAAYFDATTGVLARPGGVRRGLEYTVTSTTPTSTDCSLAAVGSSDPDVVPYQPQGDALRDYNKLAEQARLVTQGVTSPCERARVLEKWLNDHFENRPDSRPGSYIGRVSRFVFDAEGHTGTSEQFAGTFALMAQAVGLPTRVAVGFHAGDEADGRRVVKGKDAFAWPEVNFDGFGWIAFNPTPAADGEAATPPEKEEEEAETEDGGPSAPGNGPGPNVVERNLDDSASGGDDGVLSVLVPALAVVVALGLLVGLLAFLAAVGRRRRRRRRREAATRALQVVGAWRESLDVLHERRVERDAARTATQWVEVGHTVLNGATGADLAPLSKLANAALFSGAATTEGDAEQAWAFSDHVAAAARARMTRGERIRFLLDPRPMFRWRDENV